MSENERDETNEKIRRDIMRVFEEQGFEETEQECPDCGATLWKQEKEVGYGLLQTWRACSECPFLDVFYDD